LNFAASTGAGHAAPAAWRIVRPARPLERERREQRRHRRPTRRDGKPQPVVTGRQQPRIHVRLDDAAAALRRRVEPARHADERRALFLLHDVEQVRTVGLGPRIDADLSEAHDPIAAHPPIQRRRRRSRDDGRRHDDQVADLRLAARWLRPGGFGGVSATTRCSTLPTLPS
jgi:hypothetical protein